MRKRKIIISWILILAMAVNYSSVVFAAEMEGTEKASNNDIETRETIDIIDNTTDIAIEAPDDNSIPEEMGGDGQGDSPMDTAENQESGTDVQPPQDQGEGRSKEQQEEGSIDRDIAADDAADADIVDVNADTETIPEGEERTESVSSNELLPPSISENTLAIKKASVEYLSRTSQNSYIPYWDNGNYSNLIVFVDFADTAHDHPDNAFGVCYQTDTTDTFRYFNGSEEYPRGMRQYYYNISYGQLRVENIFPQYNAETDTITPYTLSKNAAYYANNKDAMVEEIITLTNNSGQLSSQMQLDLHNGDGILDNLTIVVACEEGNRNSLFSGFKATYPGADQMNGKLVRSYNLVTEMGVYFHLSNSGVIIHEFGHTLGYPDLYRSGTNSGVPVGAWDIMATESTYVQYPLAYMRYHYNGWISIPTLEESRQGLSLYAASAATEQTRDQQALILKTDYSDTEFFVVEYRKKGETYTSAGQYAQSYDAKLPGSGLIVYRVNTARSNNFEGPPDMIYVFRPGDEYNANGHESGKGDMTQAYLSLEAKRTQYGSSDFTHTLTDGAITYSDGTNSGIMISNVGSASGNQITFDITFTEKEEGKYWTTHAGEADGAATTDGAAYLDSDGTFYHILKKGSVTSGTAYFYQQKNGSFTRLGTAPAGYDHLLLKHDGSFYTAYMDSSYRATLARWNQSGWTVLYQSPGMAGGVSMTSDDQGVYMTYVNSKGTNVYAVKAVGTSAALLGAYVGSSSSYAANPSIAAENGRLAVMYREAFNNNRVVVKQYNSSNNSWSDVGSQSFRASSGSIHIHEGSLYLVSNGASATETHAYLYSYDLAKESSSWTQVGTGAFTAISVLESDLCFVGDEPYIVYTDGASPYTTRVTHILDGSWTQLGDDVAKVMLNSPEIHAQGEKLYISFINTVSQKAFVKMNLAQNEEALLEKETSQIVDKEVEGIDGQQLIISDEGLDEPLTDLQLIRILERLASKGPFERIRILRTGKENQPLERTISTKVFNTALALLEEGGELQFVLQDKAPGQEETIILALAHPREAKEDIHASITIQEAEGKRTLSITAAEFPAERVTISYETDYLADIWQSRPGAADANSLPLYYYEDTTDGERRLVTGGSCSYIAAEGSDSGQTYRLTIEEAQALSADTVYTLETTRYDWRLEYGYLVGEGRNTRGTIAYFPSEEALLAALNGVNEAADTNVAVRSVGEEQPRVLKAELLNLCADRGWNLEYIRKDIASETQFTWRFTGLRSEVEYGDYSLEIEVVSEGADLPLEYTEKAYIFLIPQGELPSGEEACLTIQKEKIAKSFIGEETVYQWNRTGDSMTLEQAAQVDQEMGSWININLKGEGEDAYLLTAQGAYGWLKAARGEEQKEAWIYLDHRSGNRFTGWRSIGGRTYYFDREGYLVQGPARIEGRWYLFGQSRDEPQGLLTGLQLIDGKEYYAGEDGRLMSGWQKLNNSWYYFDRQGRMCTGTHKIGSSYYHFYLEEGDGHKPGTLAVGEFMDAGNHYYAAKNGSLKRGWQRLKGEWKYFDTETGAQQEGIVDPITHWAEVSLKTQNGEKTSNYFYFVDGDRMANGWQKIGEDRYYFDVNGVLQSGFFNIGQSFYYGAETGKPGEGLGRLLTGEQLLNGNTYYFGDNGVMYVGFKKIEGQWRYFTTANDISVKEGEKTLTEAVNGMAMLGSERSVSAPRIQEDSWYWYTVNGKEYCFKEDKTLLKGWQTIGGNRYYMDPVTGAVAKSTQLTLGRQTYYLDENGIMVRDAVIDEHGYNRSGHQVKGWQTIEGRVYYFDTRTGALQRGNDEGLLVLGRNTYCLDENGALCAGGSDGLLNKDGNTYLTTKTGALRSGWQKVGKDWYYFSQTSMEKVEVTREYSGSNYLATVVDNGEEKTFYFQKDKLAAGWHTIEDERLYFDPATGEKKDGLFKAGKDWYYLENGEPVPGWWENDENTARYYFDQTGKAVTGWQTIGEEKYFFNSNGIMQVQKLKVGNKYYFLGARGSMRIGL